MILRYFNTNLLLLNVLIINYIFLQSVDFMICYSKLIQQFYIGSYRKILYFNLKKKINKFLYYGEADYRRSTAGRVTSSREIEIKWFGPVFSEPA